MSSDRIYRRPKPDFEAIKLSLALFSLAVVMAILAALLLVL